MQNERKESSGLRRPACAEHAFRGLPGMCAGSGFKPRAIGTVAGTVEFWHHGKAVAGVLLTDLDVVYFAMVGRCEGRAVSAICS